MLCTTRGPGAGVCPPLAWAACSEARQHVPVCASARARPHTHTHWRTGQMKMASDVSGPAPCLEPRRIAYYVLVLLPAVSMCASVCVPLVMYNSLLRETGGKQARYGGKCLLTRAMYCPGQGSPGFPASTVILHSSTAASVLVPASLGSVLFRVLVLVRCAASSSLRYGIWSELRLQRNRPLYPEPSSHGCCLTTPYTLRPCTLQLTCPFCEGMFLRSIFSKSLLLPCLRHFWMEIVRCVLAVVLGDWKERERERESERAWGG